MSKSRAAVAVSAVALLAGLTAACGAGGGKSSSAAAAFDPATCQGGTLTVLNHRGQGNFDPAELYTSGGGKVPTLVFRTLTTRDHTTDGPDSAKVVPDLATDTGKPNQDATVWTYHLKPGLKFEDGSPIKSADVKYGVERSFAPELPGGPPYLRDWLVGGEVYQGPYKGGDLASIETPDDLTIVFELRKPEGDFPFLATATQFAPVPKSKDTGTSYQKHPISSGPYKVVSNDGGKTIVLDRNPNWARSADDQRLACPDKVVVNSGLDQSVINQRLAAGTGDDANAVTSDTNVNASVLARLNSDSALKSRVVTGFFGETQYLAFNPKVKPFDDVRVRQAVSYAIDRESVVNAVGGSSVAKPATTFLPDQPAFGYSPYDYFPAGQSGDPVKAKELLAQAGYPNGLTITLSHSTVTGDGSGPEVAAAVQEALGKAGITVKLDGTADDDYQTKYQKPATEPGLFLASWGADWPSGGPFLAPVFDGRQILADGGNYNSFQLNDPKVNAEIDAANKLTDQAQAAKAWGGLDAELGKQAYTVPLFHPIYKRLYGKDVRNAYVSQWNGLYDLSRISVK
ncbi:ABC transporter substrate-binding protein [Kitasatospora sp. MAP5-34]|uniref:ABC transporter substrate-binding protein n=1 Tax=Kitasatospora sp. MAP5-34 TaxID=3035102 RepID=UPI0024751FDD|nr:ABC transporter substrate-binding protein [Kitasatospora sp. MAP5-34]MDH6574524.1 peptide/nickel transport system substrate-binding protein [Kitasatospora sp. MAP5-34]